MWESVLAVFLSMLIGLYGPGSGVVRKSPPSMPSDALIYYLPLIHKAPLVEIVETARGESFGYPTNYYVYGYVRSLTGQALYSVEVDLRVTIIPYMGTPYTEIVHITPALTATLPDQINPFSYNLLLGKASASLGPILGATAEPWTGGVVYYPLTITGWTYDGGTVHGIARNDSESPLSNLHVVGAELAKCSWSEATLDTQTLLPQQETNFYINFYSGCVDNDLVVVGQGAASP